MVTGPARSPLWGFSAVSVVSVYLLVISAALLSAGRLGDVVGRRRVFTGGMLLFTLGSGRCGFAWWLPVLVAARGVQALGSGAALALGAGMLALVKPGQDRVERFGS